MLNKYLFIILSSVLIVSGCVSDRAWKYTPEPQGSSANILLNRTVSVPPLTDKRENINRDKAMMYMIPLMPYGWQDLQVPEGRSMHLNSGRWQFRPNEDLAKAISEELQNSGIFKEVFFSYKASDGELVLRGDIISTRYHGKMFSYGLSFYGPLLWYIGFPATYIKTEMELSLRLEDSKTKKVLWAKSYKKEGSELSWLYNLHSGFVYDKYLKEIMKDAMVSIKAKFSVNSE